MSAPSSLPRALMAAVFAALTAMFLLPALAGAAVREIGGQPTKVFADGRGATQAIFTDPGVGSTTEGFWYGNDSGPASDGFSLRLASGARAGTTFGYGGSVQFFETDPDTGETVDGNGIATHTFEARDSSQAAIARVVQTSRVARGARAYRMTWQVTNASAEPLRFRSLFSGDLYVDADDSGVGVFIDGPRRFVGGTNTASRIAGGLEEILASRLPGENADTAVPRWAGYEVNHYSTIRNRNAEAAGMTGVIHTQRLDNGVGVEWEDHLADGAGLAPGATARYEVVVRLKQPAPLTLTPGQSARELSANGPVTHTVLAQLRNGDDQALAGRSVRWAIAGAHPQAGVGTSDASGDLLISWPGTVAGLDTLTAFIDENGDGTRQDQEPAATAQTHWVADNRVAGPPTVGDAPPPPGADPGTPSPTPTVFTDPENPDARTYQYTRSSTSAYPACEGGGRLMNLPVRVVLEPGAGTITNVQLLQADREDDVATATPISPSAQNGNTYDFVIPCVRTSQLFLRYTLTENGQTIVLVIPVGGLVLIDPQGVVYDRERYDQALAAAGVTDATATDAQKTAARATAALAGATARLQRRTGDTFANVLSGDPGISPNVNPQTTGANGLYQWDVSAGDYRVVVTRPGYVGVTSRAVTVPPPVLDLHIPLERVRPVAAINGPATATSGTTVRFTSGATTPDGGSIAAQAWDLDDDGQYDDATGAGAEATFAAGRRTVRLHVTDDDGDVATAAKTITVSDGPAGPAPGPAAAGGGGVPAGTPGVPTRPAAKPLRFAVTRTGVFNSTKRRLTFGIGPFAKTTKGKVRATLRRSRGKAIPVGSASFTARPGKRATVRLPVGRTAAAALRRRRSAAVVTLSITINGVTTTKQVRVPAPKRRT